MLRRHKGIIVTLILSCILRCIIVALAVQFREHPDVLRWKDWGRISFLYGFADTYTPTHLTFGTYPNNMPPGTLYVVFSMYWVWLQVGKVLAVFGIPPGSSAWVNVILLEIILRVPSLIADIGIGGVIYAFIYHLKKNTKVGIISSLLYLWNPVVVYNSAFWGQMDAINNFFGMISLWYLSRTRYVLSAMTFAASLSVKLSLIFMAPLLALWMMLEKQKWPVRTVVRFISVVCASLVICALPISMSPFSWLWRYISTNATGEMTNITAFAFNAWWVIFRPAIQFGSSYDLTKVVDVRLSGSPLTQTMYGPVSLWVIAVAISVLIYAAIYRWMMSAMHLKKTLEPRMVLSMFAILSLVSYLLLPQMHERYMFPFFAPASILIGLGMPIGREFFALTLLNLINLLIVWHPMPLPVWVFEVLRNVPFQWWTACITTGVGFWTVWKIMKSEKTV